MSRKMLDIDTVWIIYEIARLLQRLDPERKLDAGGVCSPQLNHLVESGYRVIRVRANRRPTALTHRIQGRDRFPSL